MGGRVLVVGGSKYYFGAPALAALAAYRAGADLAFLAAPQRVAISAASWNPNIIPRAFDGEVLSEDKVEYILKEAERAHVVAIGPGLGLEDVTVKAVKGLLEGLRDRPVVIDADGLKAVAKIGEPLWPNAIITPHRGEAALLAGEEGDPGELARKIAKEYNATVIVKGPVDHICEPSGRCRRNVTGVPAMSTGGTGDVLTGVVAAFLARRVSLGKDPSPLGVAAAATFVVGRAGEEAYEERGEGITAVDVLEKVPKVIREVYFGG
jgi:NAD(P)H-hydrate epimerase